MVEFGGGGDCEQGGGDGCFHFDLLCISTSMDNILNLINNWVEMCSNNNKLKLRTNTEEVLFVHFLST